MKNIVKFLIYILTTLLICYISNLYVLGVIIVLSVILCIKNKVEIGKVELISIVFCIALTGTINYFYGNLERAIAIALRLIAIYEITKIYAKSVSLMELVNVIEKIFTPLRIFRVNPKNIGIIVCISITVIPIILNEVRQKMDSMYSKGMKFGIKSIKIFFKSLMVSILVRCNEMEKSLISSGWES